MGDAVCSVAECEKPRRANGMCTMHNQRVRRHGDPHHVSRIRGDDAARFASKVDKGEGDRCWLWTAPLDRDGYATLRTPTGHVKAHRWAYEREVGPIPEGLVLDHLCRVRHCVRPSHLEPVTNAENLRRGREAA